MAYFDMEQLDDAVSGVTGSFMLPRARKKVSAGDTVTQSVTPGQALPMSLRARLGKVSQELDAMDTAEPDLTEWQNYAKQRGQEGEGAMLNALAAQFAGPQFEGLQGQLLKKAMAAQEPMKLGNALMTSNGQIIKDPYAARDTRRAALERQYGGLLSTIERQDRDAQARDDRLQQQDFMNQFRTDQARNQQNFQNESLALRREMAANRQEDHSKNWRAEDKLRNDFDNMTKDLREELNATSKITQIVSATPPGQKPDAITQQSLVILLNKFLDPGSVVREGEFDRVVKAQGLEGRARNLADRVLKGQPLDANTIGQINGLAQLYQQAATQKIKTIANNYTDIANKRKLDSGSVISDPRFRGGNVVDFNSLPK